jgi:hypothetical protein
MEWAKNFNIYRPASTLDTIINSTTQYIRSLLFTLS